MGFVVSTGTKTLRLDLWRRCFQEDKRGIRSLGSDLERTLEVDLQEDIGPRGRVRDRGSVQVAEELGPLEEALLVDLYFERAAIDEDVRVFRLARTAGAGSPRAAQPQSRVASHHTGSNGPLAGPSGAEEDEDQRIAQMEGAGESCSAAAQRAVSLRSFSRWLLPRPWRRRLSLMPTASIRRRAFTLPRPGNDSRTERTFIFPTVSLESAVLSSSARLIEPIFSFSLTSARSRRTLAALARAAWRCSGVSAGGCGMGATIAPPETVVMLNTGVMAWIDLNADLGEADELGSDDRAILDSVTSASVACGLHAGSPAVMRATAEAAANRGIAVGAHVSYRDRQGFGRRDIEVSPEQLLADIDEQIGLLRQVIGEIPVSGTEDRGSGAGVPWGHGPEEQSPAVPIRDIQGTPIRVTYVKPHGALYNRMSRDPDTAAVVIDAVRRAGSSMVLLAQAGTPVIDAARRAGLVVVAEAFPDRAYRSDGLLASRHDPGAVITDPAEVARRAVTLAVEGGVEAVDGTWLAVDANSLCVHGDSPGAAESARLVRAALEQAGIVVRTFAPGAR